MPSGFGGGGLLGQRRSWDSLHQKEHTSREQNWQVWSQTGLGACHSPTFGTREGRGDVGVREWAVQGRRKRRGSELSLAGAGDFSVEGRRHSLDFRNVGGLKRVLAPIALHCGLTG